jgi:hypothetical protein
MFQTQQPTPEVCARPRDLTTKGFGDVEEVPMTTVTEDRKVRAKAKGARDDEAKEWHR